MDKKTKDKLKDLAASITERVDRTILARQEDWRRDHLGASIMGRSCDRYVWLSHRWALNPDHDARMLRLFDRGNIEEGRFEKLLKGIGLKFRAPDGTDEFRWSHAHLGGECDGIIDDFFEGQKAIAEMKTHSLKSFERLAKKGSVKSVKKEHWYQMQLYMLNLGIEIALYCAVNKNNDELYFEIVTLDRKAATGRMDEVLKFSRLGSPPGKLEESFPPCMLTSKEGVRYPCDYHGLCHGGVDTLPEKNCRTCMESSIDDKGQWHCGHHEKPLSPDEQRAGCPDHLYNVEMINAQVSDASEDERWVDYVDSTGARHRDSRRTPDWIDRLGAVEKAGRKS